MELEIGTPWLPHDNNNQQQPLCSPPGPDNVLIADICNMETIHDCLQSSSMCPAKVTRRLSSQMNPPPTSPDRLLLLLWRTLDFAPLPLPTRFTWIPPFKWLWLRALMTHKRHIGSFACTFGECGTWWFILDSLANKKKKKRLPSRSTPLFGTMELDQREANVCIWQDTNKAKRGAL